RFHDRTALADRDKLDALAAALTKNGFEHVRQMTDEETETPILQFSVGGNGTGRKVVVNNDLLSTYEFRQMAKAFEQVSAFGLPPFTLKHGDETKVVVAI